MRQQFYKRSTALFRVRFIERLNSSDAQIFMPLMFYGSVRDRCWVTIDRFAADGRVAISVAE